MAKPGRRHLNCAFSNSVHRQIRLLVVRSRKNDPNTTIRNQRLPITPVCSCQPHLSHPHVARTSMPNRDTDRRSASVTDTVMLKHATTNSNPVSSRARGDVEETIGFIGLGRMGTAMATNLVNSGRHVKAYVRRTDRVGEFIARGLRPSNAIKHLFDCSIVITMLPDDDAVREVVLGRSGLGLDGLAL